MTFVVADGDRLGRAACEDVAADTGPADQQLGRASDLLEPAQASRERVREPRRVLRLRLRRNGEQEPRFQVGEPCGHDEVIGGEFEPQFARGLDEGEILVGEFEDRNADEIDLLAARELQQQVERTFEAVEIDLERGLSGPAVDFEIILERGRASHPNRLSSSLEDHGARAPAPQADIRGHPPLAPATSMRNGRLGNVEIIGRSRQASLNPARKTTFDDMGSIRIAIGTPGISVTGRNISDSPGPAPISTASASLNCVGNPTFALNHGHKGK